MATVEIRGHATVYGDANFYAGWPANHGAWQWGDEFLVGFMRGPYARRPMHNIRQPFEKLLARSVDGGVTWSVETPNVNFNGVFPGLTTFLEPDSDIVRFCGIYDTGGEDADPDGTFYASSDRGHSWRGAYRVGLKLPEGYVFSARTRRYDRLVFLSAMQESMWGTDYTFCAEMVDDGFKYRGIVLQDDTRAVMPAVAKIGGRLHCIMRRRRTGKREGWLDAVYSDDDGLTWSAPRYVASTGSHNGNPPALLPTHDGSALVCAYGNRDEGSMCLAIHDGKRWTGPHLLRASETANVDIGYPQLFMRNNGDFVCVYYWTTPDRPHQHISCTHFAVSG